MATLILVRHGRTTANASGVLAGRTEGVRLDEVGQEQATRAGERLAKVPITVVATSPLERCRQTTEALVAAQATPPPVEVEPGVTECDYGSWQGRTIKELAAEPLWTTVQTQPSAVVFPGGESMQTMQHRAVDAVRRLDARLVAEHGAGAFAVVVSHGDIIKSVLADALGMHLDLFQRIHVDPASISIVRYGASRPHVVASNTHAGDLGWLVPPPPAPGTGDGDGDGDGDGGGDGGGDGPGPDPDDAVVGGGAGPASPVS